MRAVLESQLEEMKNHGIIEESNSVWHSAVVMVRKSNNEWRFCVHFRKLNAVTCDSSGCCANEALNHEAECTQRLQGGRVTASAAVAKWPVQSKRFLLRFEDRIYL